MGSRALVSSPKANAGLGRYRRPLSADAPRMRNSPRAYGLRHTHQALAFCLKSSKVCWYISVLNVCSFHIPLIFSRGLHVENLQSACQSSAQGYRVREK